LALVPASGFIGSASGITIAYEAEADLSGRIGREVEVEACRIREHMKVVQLYCCAFHLTAPLSDVVHLLKGTKA
jgi:hypothetical protein